MKKLKSKPYILTLLILLLSVLCLAAGFGFAKPAFAETRSQRLYNHVYLSGYAVEMDIRSDRLIKVTEDITVYHYNNTGVIRDIPVNGGEMVKNLTVCEYTGGTEKSVPYDVYVDDGDFLSVDIGDYRYKNDEHTYRIRYDYILTKSQEGKNMLALTPLGAGWNCEIVNISATLKLPEGYVADSVSCFYQSSNNVVPMETVTSVVDGRTVITFTDDEHEGLNYALRFDLQFEEGALSTYFDFTPYWFVIVAAVILLAAVAVKFIAFNKYHLTPVATFEAPDGMSPLLIGKLIDGKIDPEDVTSMIFYWADKGYLKINFDDQKDPSLIRIVRALPQSAPEYEQVMFAEMFNGQDVIKPSFLKNRFYRTIEKVTKAVNKSVNMYDKKSVVCSVVFAIIAWIMLGLAPFIIAFTQISLHYVLIAPFITVLPLAFVYIFCLGVVSLKYKSKTGAKIGYVCGAAGVSALLTLFYVIFVPSFVIGTLPKIVLCLAVCAAVGISSILVSNTKEHTDKLNNIVGFKQFIELVEKDKLEKLIEDDPQYFYHVLPYAQVLGVSDKWEDKFKDITVQPPQWATSSNSTSLLDFIILNKIMHISMSNMTANMMSRPSSSGASGGGHGSFGGFSGGGHGGGGGRFR